MLCVKTKNGQSRRGGETRRRAIAPPQRPNYRRRHRVFRGGPVVPSGRPRWSRRVKPWAVKSVSHRPLFFIRGDPYKVERRRNMTLRPMARRDGRARNTPQTVTTPLRPATPVAIATPTTTARCITPRFLCHAAVRAHVAMPVWSSSVQFGTVENGLALVRTTLH
jgi:hypothetical protein